MTKPKTKKSDPHKTQPPAALPEGAYARLWDALGPAGLITDPGDMTPYLVEQRGLWVGKAALIARPAATGQVSAVIAICAEYGIPVVPQGGNTGLVGAGIPFEQGNEIVLSLGRMNHVRALDPLNNTITVEAGCVLADVQRAAAEADRLFPLSLGAEGSCQIGGNLSTNAGGVGVLRYGNARSLVLGLEVVLPSGAVWDGLRALRKDNTGYDLKQLFIGAEGTLGVITAAVLRLFPRPHDRATALVAVPEPAAAVALLARARDWTGDAVTAIELMSRFSVDLAVKHIPNTRDPIAGGHPWYVLLELSSQGGAGPLREGMEGVLADGMENGLALDATIAANEAQASAMWRLREAVAEAQKYEGGSIKHDVAVPVSKVPEFLARADAAVTKAMPGVRPCAFGHVGDGNIHYNLTQPAGADTEAFLAEWGRMNRVVHDIVHALGGSISAEHGLGRIKRDEVKRYKEEIELKLMRSIKAALDPQGIMNPGKVL
jgi:FAD/FMN-containing dehydrogenase